MRRRRRRRRRRTIKFSMSILLLSALEKKGIFYSTTSEVNAFNHSDGKYILYKEKKP